MMIHYVIQLLLLWLAFGLLVTLARRFLFRKPCGWLQAALEGYSLAVLALVLRGEYRWPWELLEYAKARWQSQKEISFVLFHTTSQFWRAGDASELIMNIGGNILLFVPIGFAYGLYGQNRSNPIKGLLLALLLPIAIETFQFFIGRFVDVDDVLYNFTGLCLGGLIAQWIQSGKH